MTLKQAKREFGCFPELRAHENTIIHDARRKGFAQFFPAYPDAQAQAQNTLKAAKDYLYQLASK